LGRNPRPERGNRQGERSESRVLQHGTCAADSRCPNTLDEPMRRALRKSPGGPRRRTCRSARREFIVGAGAVRQSKEPIAETLWQRCWQHRRTGVAGCCARRRRRDLPCLRLRHCRRSARRRGHKNCRSKR
jgi:hypothetical protein